MPNIFFPERLYMTCLCYNLLKKYQDAILKKKQTDRPKFWKLWMIAGNTQLCKVFANWRRSSFYNSSFGVELLGTEYSQSEIIYDSATGNGYSINHIFCSTIHWQILLLYLTLAHVRKERHHECLHHLCSMSLFIRVSSNLRCSRSHNSSITQSVSLLIQGKQKEA